MSVHPPPTSVVVEPDRRVTATRWRLFLAVLGPGLVVMLADTDVGSIVTAAQSGVRWGYKLLLLQFVLMPVVYVVQELTVRLGIFTGKGHCELIRERFGPVWAWVSVAGLGIAAAGALLTEYSGVAGVGELFGVPRIISLTLAAGFLLLLVWSGSYRRVERIALAVGLFELVFLWIAVKAHPNGAELIAGLTHAPMGDRDYLHLVAANIGAVIMPWMIFYQQSAVAEKRLRPAQYSSARWDTALGAVVTQVVMAAVLVATAATVGKVNPSGSLNTVGELSDALTPFLGPAMGRLIFSMGILGAGLVAAIVVSLAVAWGFGEVAGYKHSLGFRPAEAPWFYAVYSAGVVGGAALVAVAPDLVSLSVRVEVMNALLLPLVLGFLVALAITALPARHRLRGIYLWTVVAVSVLTTGLGVYSALSGGW
ncbi:MAG TPA: divalent metal cation transporter [Gemmatimonadales bacterium]|nr:divalent metal cation transporter [Gemmatimonadales bacterium]